MTRMLGYGVLSSVGLIAVAETTPMPGWLQGSALALLGAVLFWLLCKELPAQSKERAELFAAAQEERKADREERKQYSESMTKLAGAINSMTNVIEKCPRQDRG